MNMDLQYVVVIILSLSLTYNAGETFICHDKSAEIKCNSVQKIQIQDVVQGTHNETCQTETLPCTRNISSVHKTCNGQKTCTIHGNYLTRSICFRYPRYTTIRYTCSDTHSVRSRRHRICSSLNGLPSCNLSCIANIEILTSETYPYCDRPGNVTKSCIKSRLDQLCNGAYEKCSNGNDFDSCFYLPVYFIISYRCITDVGVVIGIVIGSLLLLITVIIVWFKKGFLSKDKRENRVICDRSRDYDNDHVYTDVEEEKQHLPRDTSVTHQQIPKSNNSYFVLDPKETGYNRTIGAQHSSTHQYDSENHYTTSVEGVYDVTNENRHVIRDDTNVYSHTVDGIYDVSGHKQTQGTEGDDNYQQFSFQAQINV